MGKTTLVLLAALAAIVVAQQGPDEDCPFLCSDGSCSDTETGCLERQIKFALREDVVCKDTISKEKCEAKKAKGRCETEKGKKKCPLTCGVCTPATTREDEVCKDTISKEKCEAKKAKGKCEKAGGKKKCPLTCG